MLSIMKKINVILDTDIANGVDDQFALCYLVKSLDNIDLQAITIAPFAGREYCQVKSLAESIDISLKTAKKVLDMVNGENFKDKIYKGANEYFYKNKESNPAVAKIIELANKNSHTTILSIGAITNVALAIYHAPEIINKIDVVWLGGNSLLINRNDDFNFRQDVDAVKMVFNSKVPLTVIPCKNVASNLLTTIYELEHYLKGKGQIGRYLCGIFKDCVRAYRKKTSDIIGESKTLWDLSAIAYVINKNWFRTQEISCPSIEDDGSYKLTNGEHKITFVNDLDRNEIYKDFFIKMGYVSEELS